MRYALLLFVFLAPLSAQDAEFYLQSHAVLQDPAVSAENRLLVLDALYGLKGSMSFMEQEVFLAEVEALARDGSEPELAKGAVHALAGILLLRREMGIDPDSQQIDLLFQAVENGSAAALRGLGDLGISSAAPLMERVLDDPRNPPDLIRCACLGLLALNGEASLAPVARYLHDDRVSSTAHYCLSEIRTPGSLSALVRSNGKHLAFALPRMEEVVLHLLKQPRHPALDHAIEATRYLRARERYVPLLRRLAETGNQTALVRAVEAARELPFEQEKMELEKLVSGNHSARLSAVMAPDTPSGFAQFSVFPYGNTTGREYGDPIYRVLLSSSIPGIPNYNHTGLFYGLNAASALRAIHAPGIGETCTEVDFVSEYQIHGDEYYGAYTVLQKVLDFTDRRTLCQTAWELEAAAMPYNLFNALLWKGADFDGTVADIDSIRCEGVVEYCYERQGIKLWWNKTKPASEWDISKWPDVQWHNDWPDFSIEPDRELSPWAQRGSPWKTGPIFSKKNPLNTRLMLPSVVRLPSYEVTLSPGVGYTDVTLKAFDESGVHKITALLPGGGASEVTVNIQHPAVDSFSVTHRIYTEGTLQYRAMDNGGNEPSTYHSVFVEVD